MASWMVLQHLLGGYVVGVLFVVPGRLTWPRPKDSRGCQSDGLYGGGIVYCSTFLSFVTSCVIGRLVHDSDMLCVIERQSITNDLICSIWYNINNALL